MGSKGRWGRWLAAGRPTRVWGRRGLLVVLVGCVVSAVVPVPVSALEPSIEIEVELVPGVFDDSATLMWRFSGPAVEDPAFADLFTEGWPALGYDHTRLVITVTGSGSPERALDLGSDIADLGDPDPLFDPLGTPCDLLDDGLVVSVIARSTSGDLTASARATVPSCPSAIRQPSEEPTPVPSAPHTSTATASTDPTGNAPVSPAPSGALAMPAAAGTTESEQVVSMTLSLLVLVGVTVIVATRIRRR